ncbi:MAG: alpha/beta hydrolase [Lachnospiraceae bacterium]|nr:alpha/beta hydrolase [Lachnospiraceae bacterium]
MAISHSVFKRVFGRKTDPPLDTIELNGTHYEEWKDIIYGSIGRLRELDFEKLHIKGCNGDRLTALKYDNGSDKTAVLYHGYRTHYLSNTAVAAGYFLDRGYNLILIISRGHEGSEGKYITFGALEHKDLLLWLEYFEKHLGIKKMVLYGISLGSNVVMRASEYIKPGIVKAIIADCGFINTKTIIHTQVVSRSKNAFQRIVFPVLAIPIVRGMRFFAKREGFDIFDGDTRVSVSRTKIPMFFIHGEKDDVVPIKETEENYRACASPKDIFISKKASHGGSFADGGDKLKDRLDAFLERFI